MDDVTFWLVFGAIVIGLLFFDLKVAHRENKIMSVKSALLWSAFWIALSLAFGVLVYIWKGPKPAGEFYTAYLVEKSLSVDNLFVFLLIFSSMKIKPEYQHRILYWGIIGAIVLRAIFIVAGVELLKQFDWLFYVVGAFLVFAGLRIGLQGEDEEYDLGKSRVYRWSRRLFPIDKDYVGDRFFIRKENGRFFATTMWLALILIESSDLIFALDSIPAILAISQDPFVVYTSNIFAILGLRSLFFALAGMMDRFQYLKYGLAVILSFIGIKIFIKHWVHIPTAVSLSVILGTLALSTIGSFFFAPKPKGEEKETEDSGEKTEA